MEVLKNMDKIVFLRKDSGVDRLNELLENGWKVIQMTVSSENESTGCYVWIRDSIKGSGIDHELLEKKQ